MALAESKRIAVLLSDVHFTVPTLELATQAFRQAAREAGALSVPLILCGDTLDSKAIIRGEVANRLISLMEETSVRKVILVGNHDLINEKGSEHCLNFLRPYAEIVDTVTFDKDTDTWFIPYQNDVDVLKQHLANIPAGSRIIMHQGVMGSEAGHYIQDHTAIPKETLGDFRVISGHYHRRQDIKCGRPRKGTVGLFSYVGNPYSLSFGEANDPDKGFQVLNNDGTLEFVPTKLRRHVVYEGPVDVLLDPVFANHALEHDLVWLKLHGTYSELKTLSKKDIGQRLLGHSNFKLDLIPTDAPKLQEDTQKLTDGEVLDKIIDNLSDTADHKAMLKGLWREVLK